MYFLRHRGCAGGHEDPDVVAESEALLSGSWAAAYEQDGSSVPTWAWLNLMAHCPDDELDQRVAAIRDQRWRNALAYLACEVRAAGKEQGRTVDEVQRSMLTPLELRMMERRPKEVGSPSALVVEVTRALNAEARISRHCPSKRVAPKNLANPPES
jgi:hypothetical protein